MRHRASRIVRRPRPRALLVALALVALAACDPSSEQQPTDDAQVHPLPDASSANADSGSALDGGPHPDASEARENDASSAALDAAVNVAAPPLTPRNFVAYPDAPVPAENPQSDEKALLGKLLFWDEQLSSDDSVACGTCHQPSAGGSDPRPSQPDYLGHPGPDRIRGTDDDPKGSPGIRTCRLGADGSILYGSSPDFGNGLQVTRRRSMSFIDAMTWTALFWDGRAGDTFVDPRDPSSVLIPHGAALESQAVVPLMSTVEMVCSGATWDDVVTKLESARPLNLASDLPDGLSAVAQASDTYGAYFANAFGTPDVTPARIAMAIASYERTLKSDQTPWDRWQSGDAAAMSETELRGLDVFVREGRCNCCHAAPWFGSQSYVNDGFSLAGWDGGRAEVTNYIGDAAAFRVPSLRNVGLREAAGLLHDGVGAGADLATLIDHYTQAPLVRSALGFCVRTSLDLSPDQRSDLLAFLRESLTDPRVRDEAAPFDRPRLRNEAKAP